MLEINLEMSVWWWLSQVVQVNGFVFCLLYVASFHWDL